MRGSIHRHRAGGFPAAGDGALPKAGGDGAAETALEKLVRMLHPDLHEHDPEKSGNFERLGGRVKAESWTAESFLKNDGFNWRWHIFTGK